MSAPSQRIRKHPVENSKLTRGHAPACRHNTSPPQKKQVRPWATETHGRTRNNHHTVTGTQRTITAPWSVSPSPGHPNPPDHLTQGRTPERTFHHEQQPQQQP